MKAFKKVIGIINRTIGAFAFGQGSVRMFCGQYKLAAYFLFAVSILFVVGYFVERWSE